MLHLAQQIELLGVGKFSGNGVYLCSTVLLYADNLNIYLKCLFLCPGVL